MGLNGRISLVTNYPTMQQVVVITLAQKKDLELPIIESLHNHDSCDEVNNIYPKQNDKQINIGPCHTCNGPHLVKDLMNQHLCILLHIVSLDKLRIWV